MRGETPPPSVQLSIWLDPWVSVGVQFWDGDFVESMTPQATDPCWDPPGDRNHLLISGPHIFVSFLLPTRKRAFLSTDRSRLCLGCGREVRGRWKQDFCEMLSWMRTWGRGKRGQESAPELNPSGCQLSQRSGAQGRRMSSSIEWREMERACGPRQERGHVWDPWVVLYLWSAHLGQTPLHGMQLNRTTGLSQIC